jgi:hypothetical protein
MTELNSLRWIALSDHDLKGADVTATRAKVFHLLAKPRLAFRRQVFPFGAFDRDLERGLALVAGESNFDASKSHAHMVVG